MLCVCLRFFAVLRIESGRSQLCGALGVPPLSFLVGGLRCLSLCWIPCVIDSSNPVLHPRLIEARARAPSGERLADQRNSGAVRSIPPQCARAVRSS